MGEVIEWIFIVFGWAGAITWYFIGKGHGYAEGYREGAADKRAQIVAGFDQCLANGDLKIYIRKGAEPVLHGAVIKIDSRPVGGTFDGGEVTH